MRWALRKSVELDRMWKRRGLHRVKRVCKTNGALRESLYAKMDREVDRMRHGLKELIADTLCMRRGRNTAPDCPKLRWN
jgi:hypothetical protein